MYNIIDFLKLQGLSLDSLRGLGTHFRPDLDACLALWAAKRLLGKIPVHFVPTGAPKEGLQENIFYMDISAGLKEGPKGECASMALIRCLPLEEQEAMSFVADFVDRHDRGDRSPIERVVLKAVPTLNMAVIGLNNYHPRDGFLVHCAMNEIFDGILISGLQRLKAEVLAQKAQILGGVAVIRQDPGTELVYGVEGFLPPKIRAVMTMIGHNVGVKRVDESLDLTQLKLSEGWFQHPSGFLAQWGDLSGKGTPANCPSTQTPSEIAELINAL